MLAAKSRFTALCNAIHPQGWVLFCWFYGQERLKAHQGAPELPARDTPKYQAASSHATHLLFILMCVAHVEGAGPKRRMLPALYPYLQPTKRLQTNMCNPQKGDTVSHCPMDTASQDGPITHALQAEIPPPLCAGRSLGEQNRSPSLKG